MKKCIYQYRFILLGLFTALLVWAADAVADTFIFSERNLQETLLHPELTELYLRLVFGLVIILFSIFVHRSVSQKDQHIMALMEYSEVLSQTDELILITDKQGLIKYANAAFYLTTGYAEHEIIGHTPAVLKSGEHDDQYYREFWHIISSGQSWKGRMVSRKKSGSLFPALMTVNPLFGEDGDIHSYIAIQRDMSEEESREQQLRQTERLHATGLLAGGIAHEFNNILAAMTNNLFLLQRRNDMNSAGMQILDSLERLTTRSAFLVKELLTFAGKERINTECINIVDLIDEMLPFLKASISKNIVLTTDHDDPLLHINIDRTMLKEVITNLVLNACDALEDAHREDPCIAISMYMVKPVKDKQAYVGIDVKDNGTGIAPELLDHIFEPFFTTKEVGEGSGLGLAMVHGCVEMHQGEITVASVPGESSCFSMHFPFSSGL